MNWENKRNKNTFIRTNPIINDIKRNIIQKRETYASSSVFKTCEFTTIGIKTVFLFLCTFVTAFPSGVCFYVFRDNMYIQSFFITLLIASFLVHIFLLFKLSFNSHAIEKYKNLVIMFALVQGISIGASISILYQSLGPTYYDFVNMILLAFLITGILFMVSHFLYSTNLIKVNQKLYLCFIASFITLFFIIFLSCFFSFFNSVAIMIPITLFCLFLGCMMICFDLHNAEFIVENKLPKEYEWKVALGFHMTLIYIFFQAIRLLQLSGMFSRQNNR
ncbi:Bax inhibitor-1/YccA family membrane protein [Candidatus Phytoplasma phoenicium]|uniref:Putative inhibitor of apoptosis-promoting Bax1 n=1 Tax=Candidatus Phytoplasma phoenicium TaxID=198422 RepID=A0A0L0MK07_9MOLU|nr:Bax inhibitor-1/YccA family protein [Candidatus Phytoplasma phoenicium]AKT74325.1 putative inhibitor of apoptosis-promoting Bax1 [Candidatus Phytoplasma phoenicium]KND62713.1 putative inhibitor of apoptosis-promoting Bax1, putative integral membrane protein [Candidatus Phytoplasma phoenicium]